MLLFATFWASFFVLTVLLVQITKLIDKHRGVTKTDQMVHEDMRWAEGREVIERKIVWDSGPGGSGGGSGTRGPRHPPSRGGNTLQKSGLREMYG